MSRPGKRKRHVERSQYLDIDRRECAGLLWYPPDAKRRRRRLIVPDPVLAGQWRLSPSRASDRHCVVPGGGLSPDRQRWIRSPPRFFLPVRVLSRVFRGKFVAGLKRAFRRRELAFFGACLPLAQEKAFRTFLRTLFREDWVVYAKRPFGGPEHVLHYLARYTHRVAISNHRLVDLTDTHVTFLWKDYAHGSKRRTMTLTHGEFLRRFLEHVLRRGLPRIRYFGFLANRRRSVFLPLCRTLLAAAPPPRRAQRRGVGRPALPSLPG